MRVKDSYEKMVWFILYVLSVNNKFKDSEYLGYE